MRMIVNDRRHVVLPTYALVVRHVSRDHWIPSWYRSYPPQGLVEF